MTFRVPTAILATFSVLAGCRSPSRGESWPPPYLRQFSSPEGRIELSLGISPIVAVGDTVPVHVTREYCHSDSCFDRGDRWNPDATWAVDRPNIAALVNGRLVAHRPGKVWVTTASGDTVLRRSVEVIPPVARFAWEPDLTRARVGDTIRVRAIARDSSGRVMRVIAASRHEAGERSAPISALIWGGPDGTVLVASGPGQLVLTAMLGRRSAILRMVIDER